MKKRGRATNKDTAKAPGEDHHGGLPETRSFGENRGVRKREEMGHLRGLKFRARPQSEEREMYDGNEKSQGRRG